ncbi:MAG: hypothetical protein ABI275_01855 [Terrimesophilobacter sp.]
MGLRNVIHKDARIALSRTQGRRAASWLIMAGCLGVMMLLWGVPLPGWVFGIIVAVPFIALLALGNYWAGLDELAAAKASRNPAATARKKPGANAGSKPAVRRASVPTGKRSSGAAAKAGSKRRG